MAEPTTQASHSGVLEQVECMSLFSGDAFPGLLVLTTERLIFTPSIDEEGAVSYGWELPLSDVESIELEPMMGRLLMSTTGLEQEVMGTDMEPFRARLADLLDKRKSGELVVDHGQEARVLMRGIIDCYLNKLMAARGEVLVTTERLVFKPSRRLETMFWGDKQIDVPLSEVKEVKIVGVRQRLEVTVGDHSHHFRGDLVPRLLGILEAVCVKDAAAEDERVLDGFPVNYFRGPMSQPGDMVITSRRIQFAPSGRLEQMVGINKRLKIALGSITRVEVHGVLDRRLVISVAADHHVFSMSQPMERLEGISNLLLNLELPDEPLVPAPGLEERSLVVNRLLDRWKGSIGGVNRAELMLLGPVLHLPRKPGVRRGWVVLTAESMAFIPVGGPTGGETPLLLPIARISDLEAKEAPAGELHVVAGNTVLQFRCQGGQPFVDNFWRLWAHELQRTEETQGPEDDTERTIGPGGFVNRRETYRARIPGGTEVQLIVPSDEGPGFTRSVPCRMRNLSLGGCAISLEEVPDIDGPVLVEIQYGGAVARVQAILAYTIQRPGARRAIYGVTFQEMDYLDAQVVREIVMQLQREDLARRAEVKL